MITTIIILAVLLLFAAGTAILLEKDNGKLRSECKSLDIRNQHLEYEIYKLNTKLKELDKYKEIEAANDKAAASLEKHNEKRAAFTS